MKWLNFKRSCLVVLLAFAANVAMANVSSPVAFLSGLSNNMIHQLNKNKTKLKRSRKVAYRIVYRVFIPNVDKVRMAQLVVRRRYWVNDCMKNRSARQCDSLRKRFVKEFVRMVVANYGSALAAYDDDRIRFYPVRRYVSRKTISVKSVIYRKNGQRIPMSYKLVRWGSKWKIYDFSIENVSMVQSYRSQFADVLARHGLAGLLEQLRRHNRRR